MGSIIILLLILGFIIHTWWLRIRISLSFVLLLPLRFFKKIKFMLVHRVVHHGSQIYGHTTPLQSLSQSSIHRHLSCMEVEEQDWSMFLPEDTLLEILARLPVKSLLRFRSVAKSWRDMVKDPFFITKHHLTRVALNNGNCLLAKTFLTFKLDFALLTKDEQGIKWNPLKLHFTPESPFWKDIWKMKITGACNGIVAISIGSHLVLWNPATREYKALPPTSLPSSWSGKHRICDDESTAFGFGIDPITKDYKVVRIWGFRGQGDIVHIAEVFSLSAYSCRPKGESWKVIDDDAPPLIHVDMAIGGLARVDMVYLNGKYYWLLSRRHHKEEWRNRIVWFDMGAEVFGFIEMPISLCRELGWCTYTVVKGSCLAMINCVPRGENKHMYNIWIIGEGGLSWTKYATIGPFLKSELPYGFWRNEELVVYDYSQEFMRESYLYNIKTHVKKKMAQGVYYDRSMQLAIYNESLVSFFGED